MNAADVVFVLPVFTAGESRSRVLTPNISSRACGRTDTVMPIALADDDALAPALAEIIAAGDIVVCMGAGSITRIAHELPTRLAEVAA